jgi:hypothetical protein
MQIGVLKITFDVFLLSMQGKRVLVAQGPPSDIVPIDWSPEEKRGMS